MCRQLLAFLMLAPGLAAQDLADEPPSPEWKEILQRTRLETLEQEQAQAQADGESASIDLSGEELPSIQPNSNHVLSRPWFQNLDLSGYAAFTYLDSGGTISAFRLSGSTITPVGAEGDSSAGTSPSDEVDTQGWEVDAQVANTRRARLLLQFGQAYIDDDVETFDRELTWFQLEPGFRLSSELELVLRHSGLGTYDDDEGYRFDGKIPADGESLGYDTTSLHRVAGGLRWLVNPHVAVKAEVGCDRFDLIDLSPLDEENDERLYFSLELVGSF